MDKTPTESVKIDPRQDLVISYYRDPNSTSFGNMKRSMIRAGYSENYANTQAGREISWLKQAKDTVFMLEQAEQNLRESLTMHTDLEKPTKTDIELLKIKMDSSKFTLKTLARSKYEPENEKADTNIQVNIVRQGKNTVIETKEV